MKEDQHTPAQESQELPGKHLPLWLDTTPETHFPTLAEGLFLDAVIIGGGLAGINTALLLHEAGLRLAIIDSHRIVTGVTGHTTAKITSLHGLVYDYLTEHFGHEGALQYADANQTAIERYAVLTKDRNISCDFERTSAYTYALDEKDAGKLMDEVRAADKLGLPVSFVETTPLPFPTEGAVCMSDQAHFHPRKYLLHLVNHMVDQGVYVFEETRALDLKGDKILEVVTDKGSIKSTHVVIATNFPFLDPAFFFARMYPKRSYVLGVRIAGTAPDGMYYSTTEPYESVHCRPAGRDDMILVGGQNHKTGHGGRTTDRYRHVERFARENFDVSSIEYHWSTQDYAAFDRVPFIGRLPRRERVYVATGFGGWGMAHSMVAAMIISDAVLGRPNPWASLYTPTRTKFAGASKLITANVEAVKDLIVGRVFPPESFNVNDLGKREGGIISYEHEKTGVARDGTGALHAVSSICTHMGCIVNWNDAEESWDCPCHGSRFTVDGQVIQGPALKDLEKKRLDKI